MARTIAIGDIHGCGIALNQLLRSIEPTGEDTIVTLGDYVDRGMGSSQVIETLIDLITRCKLVPLIGNHEIMMFKGLQNGGKDLEFWMMHGGQATVASYGGRLQNIPQDHLTFISHCLRYHETDTHFFVHACYDAFVPLNEQPDQVIFWQHVLEFPPEPHMNNKTAIVGHTPQNDGEIRDCGHLKIIDTYCYGDQWLTALEVETGMVWQANERGEVRTAQLPKT
jgi:serine/threonine protein phosphatase 1